MNKEKRYYLDAGTFSVQNKEKDTRLRFISRRNVNQDLNINILDKNNQPLPDISSPFLKKTVNNLFSLKKLTKLSPIMRYDPIQKLFLSTKILKSEESHNPQNALNNRKSFKQPEIRNETNKFDISKNTNKKIPKSFSQSKNNFQFLDLRLDELKRSIQLKQNTQCKKQLKKSRTTTQGSGTSQQSCNNIYKQLQILNVKDSWTTLQHSKGIFLPIKGQSRQMKPSNFVMRQKLTKQLYNQQREQIKLVRQALNNNASPKLTKVIQVKNYTKFFPKIMNIQ